MAQEQARSKGIFGDSFTGPTVQLGEVSAQLLGTRDWKKGHFVPSLPTLQLVQ